MYGGRPGLIGTDKDELLSLRDMVEMKMRKIKARLQQLVVGERVLQQPLPQVMLPASSSLQTQASCYTYNEIQSMAVLEEHRPLQQNWRLANLAPNYSPFAGCSTEPSSSGCEMMHPYNLGACSYSWLGNPFSPGFPTGSTNPGLKGPSFSPGFAPGTKGGNTNRG